MLTAIITWWLIVQILGLLGLPLTTLLFRSLPDRGYAFSKSLGLLLTGYGAWLLAMFGLGSFGAPLLVIVALVMGGSGILLGRGQAQEPAAEGPPPDEHAPPASRLRALLGLHHAQLSWRLVLAYEILFLLALVFLAWMRAYNPHPWGTERPMDFAFFNAIRNSAAFPPQDPWLAGYSINYYYFGYLLMASVALLSGLDPAVAFNLSLALIFALTALSIAGIVYNLITLSQPANQSQTTAEPAQAGAPRRRWTFDTRPFFAILAVVLVLVVGNQAGALQVIIGSEHSVALNGQELVSALTQALGGAEQIVLSEPVQTTDFGEFTTLEREDRLSNFNWWWPSRVLWDDYTPTGGVRQYTITEFPFFSFWLGDMHPHVMALPFGLLAMGLALATLTRPDLPAFARGRRGWLEVILSGIVLGSLYTINSWDLPTYILLYAGALVLLSVRLAGEQGGLQWREPGTQIGLVVLASFALFLPFHLTFRSLVGSAAPLLDIPLLGKLTRIISPFTIDKSGLHTFLIIFGLFVLPLSTFVYCNYALTRRAEGHPPEQKLGIVAGKTGEDIRPFALAGRLLFNPWFSPLLLVIGLLIGFPLLALLGLGIFAFRQALRRGGAPAEAFVLLIVALGCAICFGTELIYIRDVFNNRMNTIFKFYYQVWLLWGTATAYTLWWLLTHTRRTQRIVALAAGGLFVLLLVGGLVYPAINLRDMLTRSTYIGLEGTTPRENTPEGRAAIRWLRQHAPPGSVVLEMVGPGGGSYNPEGYGGVSASTGLPTVLGWVGHESQWRGGDPEARAELELRQNDVELIYSTLDANQARELLEKYNVSYIYVGHLEQQSYSAESLAKFARIAQPVFAEGSVTIYAVP